MAWVEAWMRGCMLIVSGRGQGVVLDEPERHLAGECRRDDWAVRLVSACCPFSVRVCGFCISALMFLCSGGCISGGMGAADGMGRSVDAWLHADCVRGAGRYLFSTSLSGTLPESVGEMTRLREL